MEYNAKTFKNLYSRRMKLKELIEQKDDFSGKEDCLLLLTRLYSALELNENILKENKVIHIFTSEEFNKWFTSLLSSINNALMFYTKALEQDKFSSDAFLVQLEGLLASLHEANDQIIELSKRDLNEKNADNARLRLEHIYLQSVKMLEEIEIQYSRIAGATLKLDDQQDKLDVLQRRYRASLLRFETDEAEYDNKKLNIDLAFEKSTNFLESSDRVVDVITAASLKIEEKSKLIDAIDAKLSSLDSFLNQRKTLIDTLITQSQDVLGNSTTIAVGGQFQLQYKNAKKWLWIWPVSSMSFLLGAVFICLLTVFPELFRVVFKTQDVVGGVHGEIPIIVSRLFIAPLLLVGTWFCASQYIKQKNIVEDYAHKKVLALSLLSIKEEIEKTGEHNTTEFIRAVQNEIVKSPLESLDRKHLARETKDMRMMRQEVFNLLLSKLKSEQKETIDSKK